jgi:hypothetical protein
MAHPQTADRSDNKGAECPYHKKVSDYEILYRTLGFERFYGMT